MAQSQATVRIGADVSQFQAKMREVQKSVAGMRTSLEKDLGAGLQLSNGLALGLAGVATALGTVAIAAVKSAGDMEQNQIAFETMLGSAEEAKRFLGELESMAARTPFELTDLVTGSKRLLAFGFAAKDVIPLMTSIGDAVAGLGGGAELIDQVVRALGQMQAKGAVASQEMMQLAEAGIPAWQFLANYLRVDVATAMKMVEQRQVDAVTGITAVTQGMTNKFGGLMEKQSSTLVGMWSTAKDEVAAALRSIGEDIIKTFDLKKKLKGAIDWIHEFNAEVKKVGLTRALESVVDPKIQLGVYTLAGAIMGALVPALKSLALSATAAIVPLLPLIAIGAALGGLAYEIKQILNQKADKARYDNDQKRVNDIASQYVADSKKRRAMGLKGEIRTKVEASFGPTAPTAPTGIDPAKALEIADEKAAAARKLEIRKRNADEIKKLEIAMAEDIAKAKGPKERAAIKADYSDQISKKKKELAAELAKAQRDQLSEEVAASWRAYESILTYQGRTFDAQRANAKAAYIEEIMNLENLAQKGIQVRQQMTAAAAAYYSNMRQIATDEAADQKRKYEDQVQALRDRYRTEEQSRDMVGDTVARLMELQKGEAAGELQRLDNKRKTDKRNAMETIRDAKTLAATMKAIDLEYAVNKAEISRKEMEKKQEEINAEREKQRAQVGFQSDIKSVWEQMMVAGQQLGVKGPQETPQVRLTAEGNRLLTDILGTLKTQLGLSDKMLENLGAKVGATW